MSLGAEIAPLKPLRYDLAKLASSGGLAAVVAPPYDVISPDERAALAARHTHNVVKLILPEGDGDTKYHVAAALLAHWRRDGVLVRDDEAAFYRYEQTFTPPGADPSAPPRKRRGFLGLVKLVGLDAGVVLPHERTLSGPKADRMKLFRATRTNLSPGFMLYRDPARALDAAIDRAAPLAELETPDGVRHALGKIADRDAIDAIVAGVAESQLLIADGHHRYETALRYMEETTSAGVFRPEHHYFMVFFANGDDPDLVVFPTHRLVHSLPDRARADIDALGNGAASLFDVSPLPPDASAQALLSELAKSGKERPSLVACAPDGRASLLALRADANLGSHPVLGDVPGVLARTDVALLHMGLLEPVLGVSRAMQEAKTNILYPQDATAAVRDVREGKGDLLFLMNATPVADVRRVAEAGEVMPQKSTFFYPKVLTGLCIHTLDPTRAVG
jgi:uncharacterized protein (DUF1015 family)